MDKRQLSPKNLKRISDIEYSAIFCPKLSLNFPAKSNKQFQYKTKFLY